MSGILRENLLMNVRGSHEFFNRATRVLTEEDSTFQPEEGMMTVAQQVAHVARTVDWFREGMERAEGFDMDFERHVEEAMAVTSLEAARAWYERAFEAMLATVCGMSDDRLMAPLPAGPVMGGAPRYAVVGALEDHTAHHRGALSVYARLLGKVPAMPYMDM